MTKTPHEEAQARLFARYGMGNQAVEDHLRTDPIAKAMHDCAVEVIAGLLGEPIHGTHVFEMIAAVEKGNIETTETLIHMVAGTVLAKLIQDEGGGRANISFSPADMDAMHRDYELETNRDGLITTVKLIPREGSTFTMVVEDRLMVQDEDTTAALPQAEKSPAKPYWFFNDGTKRLGPLTQDEAGQHMRIAQGPLAHVENRMCPKADCPNSDMQGACAACNPV
jgi:hypothetical protein